MDALDIFDKAPAKKLLRDQTIVFSGYCLMNVLAKTMDYTPPNYVPREDFERNLAVNFVKEMHYQYQLYHQCCALAFQADVI